MKKDSVPAAQAEPVNDHWLTNDEAAALLGISPDTLRSYRAPSKRMGPPFQKTSDRRIFYRHSGVVAWRDRERLELKAVQGRG